MSPDSPYTFLMNGHQNPNHDKIAAVQDAQEALDTILDHASRTTLTPANSVHILESIVGAWGCLNRACASL